MARYHDYFKHFADYPIVHFRCLFQMSCQLFLCSSSAIEKYTHCFVQKPDTAPSIFLSSESHIFSVSTCLQNLWVHIRQVFLNGRVNPKYWGSQDFLQNSVTLVVQNIFVDQIKMILDTFFALVMHADFLDFLVLWKVWIGSAITVQLRGMDSSLARRRLWNWCWRLFHIIINWHNMLS